MGKQITPTMRDEAAILCGIMASDLGEWFVEPCEAIGVDCWAEDGAAELARRARHASVPPFRTKNRWANAEAMLRTGWTPDDWEDEPADEHSTLVDNHTLWLLVLSDVRYSMGRASTAPSIASSHVRAFWSAFTDEQRDQLIREVKQALHLNGTWGTNLGMACDVATWRELAAWMEAQ